MSRLSTARKPLLCLLLGLELRLRSALSAFIDRRQGLPTRGRVAGALAIGLISAGCASPAGSPPVGVPTPAATILVQPVETPVRPLDTPGTRAALTQPPASTSTAQPPAVATAVPATSTFMAQSSTNRATAIPVLTPAPSQPGATSSPTVVPAQPTVSPTYVPALSPSETKVVATETTRSIVERATDFQRGQLYGSAILPGEGLRLASSDGNFALAGEFVSAEYTSEFPFNNLVLSWNADAPNGTSAKFEARVKDDLGWSGWFVLGEWRPDGGRSISGQSNSRGRVDVDTLKLSATARSFQYRVSLTSSAPAASPLVRQVAVVYSDLRKGLTGPALPRNQASVRDLPVPQRSQLEEDPSYRSLICSATSLAMLMQYWGLDRSVAQVVAGVKDRTSGIYGNWPLNTAYAAANGFDARVDRFYSVEQLEGEIAAGRPVAISIAFNPGELSASPIKSTDGHLIVVRGFTPEGDMIVNDPIAATAKSVRLVYDRDELGRIWLRSGGIVYLVSPRPNGPLAR